MFLLDGIYYTKKKKGRLAVSQSPQLMLDMENVKVLGSIALPLKSIKTKCICDDCGCEVNDKFGDPRVKISTFNSKDAKEPSAVRWVCKFCADELFSDHEPSSIFG